MTCISKGQEISHIYQGHFGDTPKQERQRILKNMFHFDCCCLACTHDYPLGKDLPDTLFDMKKQLFTSVSPSSYFQKIRTEVESYIPNEKDSTSKKDFMEDLSKKLKKRKLSEEQKLKEIFKSLEVYHQSSDKEILQTVKNNIDATLQIYYERIRIACTFLSPPQMILLTARGVITDSLWVKYGNKAYGVAQFFS